MRELIISYQTFSGKITDLRDKINTIYAAATSAKNKKISDMPMAPGFSSGGLENIFIQIEELEERITEYEMQREEVAEQIEAQLGLAGVSGTVRVVFWCREVHCMTWRETAAETGKSVRQLQRIYQKSIYTSLLS